MRITFKRDIIWLALFLVIFAGLALATAQVFAAEGSPATPPWEDAVLSVGGVSIAVGMVVQAVIQFLKGLYVRGKPLLPTEASIHFTNVLLGGVLYAVVNILNGTSPASAVVQSIIAIMTAMGGHDLLDFLRSVFGPKSHEQPAEPVG